MKRRHLVILISAITLVSVVLIAAVGLAVVVNTSFGREQVRVAIQKQLGSKVHGRLYVGEVKQGLLTGLTIDSMEIRGEDDSLFFASGEITVEYNPRDLLDRRLLLKNMTMAHPVIRLQLYPKGDWNNERIFRKSPSALPGVPGRGFGDFVMLDSVKIKDGSLVFVRPWYPADSLKGMRRDSAITYALKDTTREIRRAGASEFTHVYRWTKANLLMPHVRIAHPDSGAFGQEFQIVEGRMEEQEPPFSFRNVRGTVRHLGDSIFARIEHFDLPGSVGTINAKVWWGSGLGTRYDVKIRGDSVSMKDVAWIWPTLPRTGVGQTDIHIHNNWTNLALMEYALTNLDVRSTRSRLQGAMTFVIGDTVLGVKDVDLRGAPINFDLLRTLAGGPFSADWQGDLFGFVKGPGGRVTHFLVDTTAFTFRDDHVKGAVSRFTGKGEVDILIPDSAKFHGFQVASDLLDLRTMQAIYPEFMELGGTAWGSATLDSLWLDVRFRNGDFYHSNGAGEPSRFLGTGRVTYSETDLMTYDVSVDARPLSVPHFSRAYELGLKGSFNGPIRARGKANALRVTADLMGAPGHVTYDGTVDIDGLNFGAKGTGRVDSLDVAQFVDRKVPPAWVTGEYRVDVNADTIDIATLTGGGTFNLERSVFDGIRVFPSRVVARFDDRRMFIDTLRIESTAATVDAYGALGMSSDRVADSVTYFVTVDSVGGLRRYIAHFLPAQDPGAEPDSLSGTASLNGIVYGALTAMRVSGTLSGTNVVLRRDAGHDINGEFDVTNPFTAPTGSFSLRSQALQFAGIALDTLGITIRLNDGKTGAISVGARTLNSSTVTMRGEFTRTDSSSLLSVRSAEITTGGSRWLLAGNADVRSGGRRMTLDSLVMLNGRGGRLALSGDVPDSGRAQFAMRADSLPLTDIANLGQFRTPLAGWATIVAVGAGTKAAPVVNSDARFSGLRYGDLRLEEATLRGSYAARRARLDLDLTRGQARVLQAQATLPIELTYFGARVLEDSLQGSIRTADAPFELIQALVSGIRAPTGKLVANLDVAGTWQHPDLTGSIQVVNGEATLDTLGIRLKGIQLDIGLFGHADSLAIRRMVAWNGASAADSISLTGDIAYADYNNPRLNLRLAARNFRAIDRRTIARLEVSTGPGGISLAGPLLGATLSGGLIVDRGTVFLPDPELARKQAVDLRFLADSSALGRAVAARRASLFQSLALTNVRVTLGDEVSLRSQEADIRLSGSLNVQRAAVPVFSAALGGRDTIKYVPVLDGTLRADRGTYTPRFVQREFNVERGGTIVFYPVPDLEPELNISALHAVKRANQPDIRVRARIGGTIKNPSVVLESGESYALSQTDMVSYLIFGVPSFALSDAEADRARIATASLVTSGQTYLAGRFLSLSDNFQIRPGTINTDSLNSKGAWRDWFLTTRISVDYQLSDNVFLSGATSPCTFANQDNSNGINLFDAFSSISGKLEYRFSSSTAVRASHEPQASASNCGKQVMGRAFIPTPSQFGVSLTKSWRF